MRRHIVLLIGLIALVSAGCEKKNQEPAAHQEEPYSANTSSLDSMDASPTYGTGGTYQPPPAETTDYSNESGTASGGSDEILAPVGGDVYVVQKGDTLYKLARRFYNDQARWRDIWEANKARVPDPDKLQVGMKLIIP